MVLAEQASMIPISDNDPLPAKSECRGRLGAVHLLPVVALAVVGLLAACSQEKINTVSKVDRSNLPTMRTVSVSTLISDSGFTRYHITAPLWLMLDEAQEPHWDFPEGLDMVRYDNDKAEEATFRSDSAKFFNAKRLWRFDGNVRMRNVEGDRFVTEQIFWDQQKGKVYSDSFIHIERIDRTIEGVGFESNEQMTEYVIREVQGILPMPVRRDSAVQATSSALPSDTVLHDTVAVDAGASQRSRKQNKRES